MIIRFLLQFFSSFSFHVLELAVAAGVELPDRLEARRRRWRELAVSSGDGTGDGSTVPDPGREEAPGRSRGRQDVR